MAEFQENLSYLTKKVIEHRLTGYTFEETADKVGITTEEAVKEWKGYVASRTKMPKEEQWLLHLLRLESMLVKANLRLENAQFAEDFELVLKLLDRIEALQSLNFSRKEVAELEAEKVSRLLAEQVIGILEASKEQTQYMIENAFSQHKTLKAAKQAMLEDLGEYTTRALTKLEEEETVED
jgi:hypothetical protein